MCKEGHLNDTIPTTRQHTCFLIQSEWNPNANLDYFNRSWAGPRRSGHLQHGLKAVKTTGLVRKPECLLWHIRTWLTWSFFSTGFTALQCDCHSGFTHVATFSAFVYFCFQFHLSSLTAQSICLWRNSVDFSWSMEAKSERPLSDLWVLRLAQ